jgi:hypothetical protein
VRSAIFGEGFLVTPTSLPYERMQSVDLFDSYGASNPFGEVLNLARPRELASRS